MTWTKLVGALVIATATIGGLSGAAAQEGGGAPPSWELGVAAAAFVDYPSRNAELYCDQRSYGGTAHVSRWLRRWLGLQGRAVLGLGATDESGCFAAYPPSPAPIPVGEPFNRNAYVEGDFSDTMLATDLGTVVEPWRGSDISPYGTARLGWMVNHGMSVRSLGGGVRFGFGTHALTIDGAWWTFSLDVRNELVVYRQNGQLEVLDATVFDSSQSLFLIRLGWVLGIR